MLQAVLTDTTIRARESSPLQALFATFVNTRAFLDNVPTGTPDEAVNAATETDHFVTVALSQAPAQTRGDIIRKMEALVARLAEGQESYGDPFSTANNALGSSVLSDLRALIAH
jgi:hypothetical protein